MIKELIDLQRNSKATCAIIKTNECKLLVPAVVIDSSIDDKFLFLSSKPIFAEKIMTESAKNDICYLVIKDIDKVSASLQDRFVGLVKDRQIEDFVLPNNCVVVFSVCDKNSLKNVSPKLYHFAVVAI